MNRKDFFNKIIQKPAETVYTLPATGFDYSLKPYKGKWDDAAVIHFLKRTMFGAKPSDITYFKKRSLKKAINEIIDNAPPVTNFPINNYSDNNVIDDEVPACATWINTTNFSGKLNGKRRNSYKQWWMGAMINQSASITEKMVLFWHNHLTTETGTVDNPVFCYRYNILLRQFALGNFKEMVKAITTDMCMLRYLNGNSSSKKAPDENYGRELQELFTVGKGPGSHYTEADVKAAARVLTGFKNDDKKVSYVFDEKRHDDADKQFSAFYNNTIIKGRKGADGALELDDLINMIFAQEEVARFICRKLYRFFVFYIIDANTEEQIIIPLAKLLVKNNYEIKPVLVTLLSSRHFFDAAIRGTMIKSPVDLCVGLIREYNISLYEPDDLLANYGMYEFIRSQAAAMQQNIGDPPNVAGWAAYYQAPEFYKLWINSDTLPKRNLFSDRFVTNGYNYLKESKKIMVDVLAYAKALPHPEDPDALINDSLKLLYTIDLPPDEKLRIKSNILLSNLQGDEANHYWTNAWNNLTDKPADETNKKQVILKLKNLYKYLMNRPEYQVY